MNPSRSNLLFAALVVAASTTFTSTIQAASPSRVVLDHIESKTLKNAVIKINPRRSVSVYLPPDYDDSDKLYPVIYYFHSLWWNNEQMFADGPSSYKTILDDAIERGQIPGFIFVAANFGSDINEPVGIFYANSPVSGNWLDFITDELMPFVENRYRIIRRRECRALAGDFFGGYAALKLGMLHPDKFNALYAMHPVGTGTGLIPMTRKIDWRRLNEATSTADLEDDVISRIFVAMAQAYAPNPNKPPFYCDFMVNLKNGHLVANREVAEGLRSRFLLDRLLPQYAANLKELRAIKLDWGRYDDNQDHVYANQALTRALDEY